MMRNWMVDDESPQDESQHLKIQLPHFVIVLPTVHLSFILLLFPAVYQMLLELGSFIRD